MFKQKNGHNYGLFSKMKYLLGRYFGFKNNNDASVFLVKLPEPSYVYKKDDVVFSVYKVKDYFNEKWLDEKLKRLVFKLRGTFLRYGNVPLFDEYDRKSAVYLVKASSSIDTSDGKKIICDEWISVRFVPSDGEPNLSEDLDVCLIKDKTFFDFFDNDPSINKKYHSKNIVTISRLCGMKNVNFNSVKSENISFPNKLQYTTDSFAVLCDVFLNEIEEKKLPFQLVTCLMRPDFVKKFMIENDNDDVIKFPLTLAKDFLKLPGNHIKIDRKYLSYRYPGYFLKGEHLLNFLHKLIREKRISIISLKKYLGHDFDINMLNKIFYRSKLKFLNKLSKLGDLLSVEGVIEGSTLTGDELRKILDKEVADAPNLYLMDIPEWNKDIKLLLKNLKINKI